MVVLEFLRGEAQTLALSWCPQKESWEKGADGGMLERDLQMKMIPSISGDQRSWMPVLNGGSFVVSLARTSPYFLFCIRADVKAMWEEGWQSLVGVGSCA